MTALALFDQPRPVTVTSRVEAPFTGHALGIGVDDLPRDTKVLVARDTDRTAAWYVLPFVTWTTP